VRRCAGTAALLALAMALGACSTHAERTAEQLRAVAADNCAKGNQAACSTVIQPRGDSGVVIRSTFSVNVLTPECDNGDMNVCRQLAVLYAELLAWCGPKNTQACDAVHQATWPHEWDVSVLIEEARQKCARGEFKAESDTCDALRNM